MSTILYQKDFPVDKEFVLANFIEILDNEDFYPFLLIIEKISDWQYRCEFQHVAKLSPIPMTGLRKGNVADEMLLPEFILERLKEDIRITASIKSTTLLFMGLFTLLFMSAAILFRTFFAWIPIMFYIGAQLLKYYWDTKRFNHIGQIANQFLSIK